MQAAVAAPASLSDPGWGLRAKGNETNRAQIEVFNIGVDGVSERHSGKDHRTKSEKTNGRGERFHDRELPLPTQMHIMASNQEASTLCQINRR